jgi:excinuclease UvrABC nuclease subunit
MNFVVYAFHDEKRRCLYVGTTTDMPRRYREHERTAPWWPRAAYLDAIDARDEQAAQAIERAFIHAFNPIWNARENRGNRTGKPTIERDLNE